MTATKSVEHPRTGRAASAHVAGHPSVRTLCVFLSEYAATLLGAGATCIRLERNVDRMAAALGCRVVMTIMPRHIHMTVVSLTTSQSYTYIAAIGHDCISFDVNTRLSELSWDLADGRITFEQAQKCLDGIYHIPSMAAWRILLLASLANLAFCRLFGGDWQAMITVFIATAAGFYIKQQLVSRGTGVLVVFVICAFVSSVIAAGDALFGFGTTPQVAVGTSVLYLVPGIPFLNSFSDMLAGHYICAFSRFLHACLLTASLSLGLCGGMLLMNIGMF